METSGKKYGRALVAPDGAVRWVDRDLEHYNEAENVLRERGLDARGYDASDVLEDEGWVRVHGGSFTTPSRFYPVKALTQAQRDTLFDMAMALNADGWERAARDLVAELDDIPE